MVAPLPTNVFVVGISHFPQISLLIIPHLYLPGEGQSDQWISIYVLFFHCNYLFWMHFVGGEVYSGEFHCLNIVYAYKVVCAYKIVDISIAEAKIKHFSAIIVLYSYNMKRPFHCFQNIYRIFHTWFLVFIFWSPRHI